MHTSTLAQKVLTSQPLSTQPPLPATSLRNAVGLPHVRPIFSPPGKGGDALADSAGPGRAAGDREVKGQRTGGTEGDSEGELGERHRGSRRDVVPGFEARREGRGQGRAGKCHPWPIPEMGCQEGQVQTPPPLRTRGLGMLPALPESHPPDISESQILTLAYGGM